jgi:uncharacterized protein YkwD
MPRRMLILLVTLSSLFPTLPTAQARPNAQQCFPSTPGVADCLAGRFAQYWQSSGGLPVFGFPITPLYDAPTRNGIVLAQMVERNRLEYHPELAPPYDILLGRLGEDLLLARGRDWRVEPKGLPKMDCWFAEATEHTVCDQEPGIGFLSHYRTYGLDLGDPGISQRESLALWGYPLTEPAIETNVAGDRVLTQWFERARFEYHPQNPRQYRVLLGLLGREWWGAQARPRASFQPAPPAVNEMIPPSPSPAPPAPPTPTHVVPPEEPPPAVTPTSTPVPEIAPTVVPDPVDEALKQELFVLADARHQEAGCVPFVWDNRLAAAAQAHAADIASHRRIDHVGTDGATLRERLSRVAYPFSRASESIAVYKTPELAVAAWMNEPANGPHRMNLTNCQYTDTGVGLAYDNRGWRWWVMVYANRRAGN